MIEHLYIQNFRCLESVSIRLKQKSSVLFIGRNGAGKSTLREALGVFQRIGRGAGRVGSLIESKDFSFGRMERPMRFEMSATLNGRFFEYSIAFEWPKTFREARISEESLKVDSQVVFTRKQGQIELPNGTSFGLDWHTAALLVFNEKPPGTAVSDMRSFLSSMILCQPIPKLMSGFSEDVSEELQEDASNTSSCIRGLFESKPSSYSVFEKYIRTVMSDFAFLEFKDRGQYGKQLVIHFRDGEKERAEDFDNLSDGEKCFFLGAYIIALSSTGLPSVCMWDEPDNHLSIAETQQFITSLRQMAKKGGQFFATSHHPEAIRCFSDETTIVVTRRSHMEPSAIKGLDEVQYHGDLIEALLRSEVLT